jgi:prepilin-type N-terminal cleavage/methylation domain-containing protein
MHVKKRSLGSKGFSLVEVLTAVSLLAMFAGGALWTLTQTNRYAALSRLYTGAQLAAQNQVDLIMSKGPFNPQNLKDDGTPDPQWPVLNPLKPDGTPTPDNEKVTLKPGAWPTLPPYETVTIYSEPGGQTVTAERVTTVSTDSPPKVVSGRTLYIYYATVVVTFYYPPSPAGVPPPPWTRHQVQLNAMRASDVEGG